MGNGNKTAKIIIAAAAAALCTVGVITTAFVVCKRLYEKTYFTAVNPSAV